MGRGEREEKNQPHSMSQSTLTVYYGAVIKLTASAKAVRYHAARWRCNWKSDELIEDDDVDDDSDAGKTNC